MSNFKNIVGFLKYGMFIPQEIKANREYISHETYSRDEINELNFNKRCEILRFAYEQSPFYKTRFDSLGLHPNDIKTENDWNQIPVLTKSEVRESFDRIKVSSVPQKYCRIATTGGSTGVPLKVLNDRRFEVRVLGWRARRWWGVPSFCTYAICGRVIKKSNLFASIAAFPNVSVGLNASHMTVSSMNAFVTSIQRKKPLLFYGYAGGIFQFAQYCQEHNIDFDCFKAIVTTSSPLSAPQKQTIEQAFNAPVFDQYGCCEINWLALQCSCRKHLHINSDARHIEFLSEDGHTPVPDGVLGNITVTDLGNRVFPLIRYQMGDMGKAVKGVCECGMPFPLMESVKGRVSDSLTFPNGTIVAGEFATTLFDAFPNAVKGFQVFQRPDYSIEIRVIPNTDYPESAKEIEIVRENFYRVVTPTPVKVVVYTELPHDRGKTRFVVSEVKKTE